MRIFRLGRKRVRDSVKGAYADGTERTWQYGIHNFCVKQQQLFLGIGRILHLLKLFNKCMHDDCRHITCGHRNHIREHQIIPAVDQPAAGAKQKQSRADAVNGQREQTDGGIAYIQIKIYVQTV